MRPPVSADIGGQSFRLQLLGQTFEDAEAEGVDLFSLLDDPKPANICTLLYWAARRHHPEVTRGQMLELVDFRDLSDLATVAAALFRSSQGEANDGDGGPTGRAATGKP